MGAKTMFASGESGVFQNPSVWYRYLAHTLAAVFVFQLTTLDALAAGPLDRLIDLNIPEHTRMEDALIEWGMKAGLTLMINTPSVEHQYTTRPIQGTWPAAQALSVLLSGSGLTYTADRNTIHVLPMGTLSLSALREEEAPLTQSATRFG